MSGTPAPESRIPAEDLSADGPEIGDDVVSPEMTAADGDETEGSGGALEADELEGEAPAAERGRAGAKSPTAFRTISEVSAELDVPQHVLRFWETKFPHIRPLKRGGGRRYYRPDDVELLRRIQVLLYKEGYTIKGVQRLLRTGGGRSLPAIPDPTGADEAAAEGVDESWVEPAPQPPPAPRAQPEEKLRIIGLFDHDPEADPEWSRTPPPVAEPVAARTHEPRRVPAEKAEKGLSAPKREALGQVLADLEEIRDLLRRVL
ncbi:MerR family transcriptional regulator [Nitrospirillum sp. BR 11163]|uniref:MerR family transcriptional regulator n=1 Tax=Nitrospirillum sp. BR 11163 TaxID=3104323 RepID=UPI002AFE6C1D|nr:MerR family transcriptional regulator [Nitrospirillum sp. BR 11163]MEA1676332.1 MerR family transcriptional regulator [Nitrospirillum sp. BR 11163]